MCKFTYTHILAIFNLVQLSYILSIALLYVLSVRQKVPKSRAVVYGIRCFLCSRVALQHLSVGAHLAARCLSQCLGWQELAALKHHATCFQALLGCSLCLPMLPFRFQRRITFCNEKARRIVIFNTAPPDFASEPLIVHLQIRRSNIRIAPQLLRSYCLCVQDITCR